MKKLLILLLPVVALAQVPKDNQAWLVSTNNGTIISGRTFTSITDTTEAFNIIQHKTVYVSLAVLDTATILIDYALSLDGSNYTAFTLKDSLQGQPANNMAFVKSVDFTSTALGAGFIKFRFRSSANAFALGTTTPTYTATVTRKRY